MAKQLLGLWLMCLMLFCFQSIQAQNSQSVPTPQPVKALVLEHQLNLSNTEDAQKMESFATFLKENYGKGGQVVYLPEAKTYACLDRSENADFIKSVKSAVGAKFSFVNLTEMDEAAFGKKYPQELQMFKSNSSSTVNLKENVAFPGQRRDGK